MNLPINDVVLGDDRLALFDDLAAVDHLVEEEGSDRRSENVGGHCIGGRCLRAGEEGVHIDDPSTEVRNRTLDLDLELDEGVGLENVDLGHLQGHCLAHDPHRACTGGGCQNSGSHASCRTVATLWTRRNDALKRAGPVSENGLPCLLPGSFLKNNVFQGSGRRRETG